jgi:hypothetical protein
MADLNTDDFKPHKPRCQCMSDLMRNHGDVKEWINEQKIGHCAGRPVGFVVNCQSHSTNKQRQPDEKP